MLLTPGCSPAPAPQLDPITAGLALPAIGAEALAAAGLLPATGLIVGFTPATGNE